MSLGAQQAMMSPPGLHCMPDSRLRGAGGSLGPRGLHAALCRAGSLQEEGHSWPLRTQRYLPWQARSPS